MKLKPNIKIKQIGNDPIMLLNEEGSMNFTRIITLNKSAEYLICESLQDKEFTPATWAELLSLKYAIDNEQALTDAEALIEKLKAADVIL